MKATLVPVFFKRDKTKKFEQQSQYIIEAMANEARVLSPIAIGDSVPPEADAVVFPEILGEAYEYSEVFQNYKVPILILTNEFMTISMWDWEIMNFLKAKGVEVLAPYSKEQSQVICRALATKRSLQDSSFLIFQDNPGEGFQPEIFKCFYWWTEECTALLHQRFGVTVERKSLEELGKIERSITDTVAQAEVETWDFPISSSLTDTMKINAAKYYLAVKQHLEGRTDIRGIGSNCLNESRFSSSTPCIAWNLLYEREKLMWVCEGDTLTLLTQYILHNSLNAPVMMSNIYPVLMGMAALKHEGIPSFPEILDDPENHILLAHCGYFGLIPPSFSEQYVATAPVLKIVDEQAHMIDARYPAGPITMVKIDSSMKKMMVIEGTLKGYVQYPGTDTRNGAIVRVADGHRFMRDTYSHHQILLPGHHKKHLEGVAHIFDLEIETI